MGRKLGIASIHNDDEGLLNGLTESLTCTEVDMTIFFRRLASMDLMQHDLNQIADSDLVKNLQDAYYQPEDLSADLMSSTANWLKQYQQRLKQDGITEFDRRTLMNSVNPKFVLRNYLAQQAIDASTEGDHSLVNRLLEVMKRPYDEQPDQEQYAEKRPEWARTKAGCSMLSCSS